MSHLSVTLNSNPLVIKPDTEIELTDSNPLFNSQAETLSIPFTVPLDGNREKLGNVDCIESDAKLLSIEDAVMGVEVDGVLLRQGKLGTIEDQQLRDEVAIQMVGAVYSLDDYLDGVRCRDVPVDNDICIGETIGDLQVKYGFGGNSSIHVRIGYWVNSLDAFEEIVVSLGDVHSMDVSAKLPAIGFSRPDRSRMYSSAFSNGDAEKNIEPTPEANYINVSTPYPSARYCNSRVCYLHYDKDSEGNTSDTVMVSRSGSALDRYNPYLVLEANRPASGICFYVLYFLDKLFAMFREDALIYDNTELLKSQDLCRLAFFTTHCKFDTRVRDNYSLPYPHLGGIEAINRFFRSRNIKTEAKFNQAKDWDETIQSVVVPYFGGQREFRVGDNFINGVFSPIKTISVRADNINPLVTANIHDMYANSQNFPDADAKTIIDSLWGSFGIKFLFDQQSRVVKPLFIRNVFRDTSVPIVFPCKVISATKSADYTTGFKMRYNEESDEQQRKDNITTGQTDYDTVYDYEDYRNLVMVDDYTVITNNVYDTNMNCYVDLTTGNIYRIKVNGSADVRKDYKPSLFEVGQLHGVELGDCSADNDRVEEVVSYFQPVIMNDLLRSASSYSSFSSGGINVNHRREQLLSPFVPEDMEHEDTPRSLSYPFGDGVAVCSLDFICKTTESFDPSKDGDSPLQSLDWGLAVAIMRGGGYDAKFDVYDSGYDQLEGMAYPELFGCSKYRMLPSDKYSMSYDSVDAFGNEYDYNGEIEGSGGGERISMKIRTCIPAPFDVYDENGNVRFQKGEPLCSNPDLMHRGLFDQYMSEYARFVLDRKPVILEILCEPSALLNIQWTKRYRFGDYVGWINKIRTTVSAADGIKHCEVELYVM